MFSDEALRAAVNVQQTYEQHMALVRELRRYKHSVGWKTISSRDYLYNNTLGKSLGLRSPVTEAQWESYTSNKKRLTALCTSYENKLRTHCAIYKFSKLPLIDAGFARLCRAVDEHDLLGSTVIVVGTVCIAAYELEAQEGFDLSLATDDIDFSWVRESDAGEAILWPALKEFDSFFCVTEHDFTARNRSGIILDLISSAERIGTANREPLKAIVIEGQEWLLKGTWVDQVVCGADRTPCRIVAPDPRWFALHKAWLSALPNRNKLKIKKDNAQAVAIWAQLPNMGRFPIDDVFLHELRKVPKLWPAFESLHKVTLDAEPEVIVPRATFSMKN